MNNLFLGIDLGATTVKTGCVSQDGTILSELKISTEAHGGPQAVVQQIMKTMICLYKK